MTGTDTIFSDTVHIAASGVYVLYLIGINGCTRSGPVVVQLFEHADINITGVVPELVGSDTIHTCEANCIYGTFTNTWYVDGVPTALPDGLLQSYTGSGGCNQSGVMTMISADRMKSVRMAPLILSFSIATRSIAGSARALMIS